MADNTEHEEQEQEQTEEQTRHSAIDELIQMTKQPRAPKPEAGEEETTSEIQEDDVTTSTEAGTSEEEEAGAGAAEPEEPTGGEGEPKTDREQQSSEETEEEVDLTDEVTQLRKTVDSLLQARETKPPAETPTEEAGTGATEEEAAADTVDLDITEEEYEEALSSHKKFMALIKKVQESAAVNTEERILRRIPDIVDKTYKRQSTVQSAVQNFYSENKDLKAHARYVSYVFNSLQSESPDAPVESLLKKTGERVRKDLALNKQAEETEERRSQNNNNNRSQPAFAGQGRRGAPPSDQRTKQQKQVDEILI